MQNVCKRGRGSELGVFKKEGGGGGTAASRALEDNVTKLVW